MKLLKGLLRLFNLGLVTMIGGVLLWSGTPPPEVQLPPAEAATPPSPRPPRADVPNPLTAD